MMVHYYENEEKMIIHYHNNFGELESFRLFYKSFYMRTRMEKFSEKGINSPTIQPVVNRFQKCICTFQIVNNLLSVLIIDDALSIIHYVVYHHLSRNRAGRGDIL
jgi:hypothetical protein